ncbi:MAG: class I SAM-dependent methyltransferase [Chloroflexota bacterium]|nr:class I SAM-dependent methyltransferase [Chloroflexota bacterium]
MSRAEAALGAADTSCLVDLDLVRPARNRLEPLARIDRSGRWLITSDLRRRRWQADYVVGPGPATFLLARYLRRDAAVRALDLGCGSGFLSLVLASAGASVVSLDINPRAVAFARFNAALNGRRALAPELEDFLSRPTEALEGRFDAVVSNPPFVLAPAQRLVYRDRPLPGDQTSARTVERVGRALAPGGRGHVRCNWIGRGGA